MADQVQPTQDELDEVPAPPLEAYEADLQEDVNAMLAREAAGAGPDLDPGGPPPTNEWAEQQAARDEERRAARQALMDKLNPNQRRAVTMPHRSALVLAAAGSGKTSVLTARVTKLVTDGEPTIAARSVLAVTFTNKAAMEMRSRLMKMLDRRTVNDLWVGTFHSLCNRILRENAQAAGLPKNFAILDVDGQETLCRGILKDLGLTRATVKAAREAAGLAPLPTRRGAAASAAAQMDLLGDANLTAAARVNAAGGMSAAEAGVRDGGDAGEFVTPAQCASYINSRKEKQQAPNPPITAVTHRSIAVEQFEAVFAEYQQRCARSGLLDFQDLLTRTVKLLEEDREVRDKLRDKFKAILVDEFQDTNDIQYRWLELMKGKDAHVMAVGDDDQSIYAFRGARPENMARFLVEMAGGGRSDAREHLIRLEENYRSRPYILEAANALISHNTSRLGKTLQTSQADAGDKLELTRFADGLAEARSIADAIAQLVHEQQVPASEVAVLYRANQQSRVLESELNKRGIPITVYGGFRFYERQEVKYVLAYLDLVNDLTRDLSFARVANFPPRGLGERTIEDLRQEANQQNISMAEVVANNQVLRERDARSMGTASALKRQILLESFVNIVASLAERAAAMPLHKLIEATLEESGLLAHYLAEAHESGDKGVGERVENMQELVSAARQFVFDNPDLEREDTLTQLTEYLAHVALMTSTSESDMHAKQTVSLMTVHSSKGLEFDHVFVAGMEDEMFPHSRAIMADKENAHEVVESSHMLALQDAQGLAAAEARRRQGRLPDGPNVQEERRLAYVAITRARHTLAMSFCDCRLLNGEFKDFGPSRFLYELPQHRIRYIDQASDGKESLIQFGPAGEAAHARTTIGTTASIAKAAAAPRKPPTSDATTSVRAGPASAPAPGAAPAKKLSPFAAAAAQSREEDLAAWRAARNTQAGRSPATTPAHTHAARAAPQTPSSPAHGEATGAAVGGVASGDGRPPILAPARKAAPRVPAPTARQAGDSRHIGLIGTAGRDKERSTQMTEAMWQSMLADARTRVRPGDTLVSGGAAWADHLAVALFLEGSASGLKLHLPAPIGADGRFEGPTLSAGGSAGSAANYYHDLFRRATGIDGLAQLQQAIARGAVATVQPPSRGYRAMMARNELVARDSQELIAYTWGDSEVPADGGTHATWDMATQAERVHVPLSALSAAGACAQDQPSNEERPRMRA